MDFHRVKSVKVVKDSEDRWTTLHIVREENVNLDDESVKHIAGMLSMREIDVLRVLNFTRGLSTLTEEITLFPVANESIEWDVE
jgi:NADH:ubiquinone oxidoreductase subunit E